MHIYHARIAGFNFLTATFDEVDLQIVWPCTKTTKLSNPNLFDLGDVIGEHAIECEVCDDGRIDSSNTPERNKA